jgi:hypothetical protein
LKTAIEEFTSLTGWSGSSAKASAYAVNEIPEFIAGLNDKSVIFKFTNSPSGSYVTKTISVNLTGYDEITFHLWSRNKKGAGANQQLSSEYAYKIDFGSGKEFFVPVFDTFTDITFDISSIQTTVTRIRITCLHNDDDYIILSHMVAVKDELPLDIWRSVREQLLYDLNSLYPRITNGQASKGILIGTCGGTAGDSTIIFSDSLRLASKYAVIMIQDNTHTERHQIDSNDELEFKFTSNLDGKTLKYTYTNANVFLTIPIEYGLSEEEIYLPGINIQGLSPEEDLEINKLDHVRDTFRPDETVEDRRADANFEYIILIDGEARTNEMIGFMSLLIRYFLARQILWVNGKHIEIRPQGSSSYVEPVEGVNQIPKIQYSMTITVKEEVYNRLKLYKTLSNTRTFTIQEA